MGKRGGALNGLLLQHCITGGFQAACGGLLGLGRRWARCSVARLGVAGALAWVFAGGAGAGGFGGDILALHWGCYLAAGEVRSRLRP